MSLPFVASRSRARRPKDRVTELQNNRVNDDGRTKCELNNWLQPPLLRRPFIRPFLFSCFSWFFPSFSILPSPFSILHFSFSLLHSPFSILPSPFSILNPQPSTLSSFSILHFPFSILPHTKHLQITLKTANITDSKFSYGTRYRWCRLFVRCI